MQRERLVKISFVSNRKHLFSMMSQVESSNPYDNIKREETFEMIITLKDGSKKEYAQPISVLDIAKDISEGLARVATAGEVNGEVVDLRTVIEKDCELNILTANDEKGLAALRHTTSHVLAEAVKRLRPEAKLAIGPSIDTGFYYDFECEPFSREDLDAFEKK